jgi:hypothetical protein
MSKAPVEELVMITSSDGFVPAAVDAARAELARRNLGADDLARVMEADADERQQAADARAAIPLGIAGKIAFLIFGPALFWTILAAIFLGSRGYRRKSVDALMWIAISVGVWLCVIVFVGTLARR